MRHVLVTLLSMLSLAAAEASATSLATMSLDEMVACAHSIVLGRVQAVRHATSDDFDKSEFFNVATVRVERQFKGPAIETVSVRVTRPGGLDAEPQPGEEAYVFLRRERAGFSVLQAAVGYLPIIDGRVQIYKISQLDPQRSLREQIVERVVAGLPCTEEPSRPTP